MNFSRPTARVLGRYALHSVVGTGGMATVYLARMRGDAGFARIVAVKTLHPFLTKEPDLAQMFVDEARLAARVRHPNVVATLDVVEVDGELLQVLEWVEGESLARLARPSTDPGRTLVALPIVLTVMGGVLAGLHAAHEAKDEHGELLGLVHRDVSPQNIMVGAADGVARVLDFGIAKARGRIHTTKDGSIRGKLRYMPAEQLQGKPATRTNDIYGAGVVLWELLTGLPLIEPGDEGALVTQVLTGIVEPPSRYRKEISPELDEVVLRALARDPAERFPTARDMALALQNAGTAATAFAVAEWVQATAREGLAERAAMVVAAEGAADRISDDQAAVQAAATAVASRVEHELPTAKRIPIIEATSARATAADVPPPATKRRRGGRATAIAMLAIALLIGVGVVFGRRATPPSVRATTLPVDDGAALASAITSTSAVTLATAVASASTSAPSVPSGLPSPARRTTFVTSRPKPKPSSGAPTRDGTEDWK